jgi:hypothetical protein
VGKSLCEGYEFAGARLRSLVLHDLQGAWQSNYNMVPEFSEAWDNYWYFGLKVHLRPLELGLTWASGDAKGVNTKICYSDIRPLTIVKTQPT